ncbi:hypothetical protein DIJ64_01665 [Mycobacterium leprae]|uniref:Uncharacterized protein n=1 Tax=Mycobacterium leprae TaxID=1769 RepID=A0AAD0P768_MYCLR|nr:hypothetical protein DIJ64_01665 [Mycobacterium leprae]
MMTDYGQLKIVSGSVADIMICARPAVVVPLIETLRQNLTAGVVAQLSLLVFDNSAMDGAMRYAPRTLQRTKSEHPVLLPVLFFRTHRSIDVAAR